jgi:ribonuclease BN (tRNA processing enzyme)
MFGHIVPSAAHAVAPPTRLAAQNAAKPAAANPATHVPAWGTLGTMGTMGGPMPLKGRSQPADALVWPDEAWLVDCGDSAMGQLAEAGLGPRATAVVLFSHLHFDHTEGLAGVIGPRLETSAPGRLAIYGPPGTKALIDGIIGSMKPAAEAGFVPPGKRR